MERKLVTIRTVGDLTPIEGADLIQTAHVDGWSIVVKKGEFHAEEDILMFEVDSFLPIDDRYEFLRKGCLKVQEGKEGFRLKTVKLRGQISQGLVLPLSMFPEIVDPEPEVDYAEVLGVVKWDPPVASHLAGMVKGNFPSRIKKTDQERIQNLPKFFHGKFKGICFEVSIKLDGSSCTVYHDSGNFGVCSRNLDLKEDEGNTFWKVVNRLGLRDTLISKGKNVAIQGELMGEGIQGNKEGLKGHELFVFDIWLIDEQRHMTTTERLEFLEGVAVKHVPILGSFPVFNLYPTMGEMIDYSGAGKSLNAEVREGLVFKCAEVIDGEVVSFKCINPKFLLKEKD